MRTAADARTHVRTALVTGAAGFIGCHLTERLVADGWMVRGIDDERTGDWGRVKVPVDRIDRSLEEMSPAELRTACAGVDVLFHLAAEKHNTPGRTAERTVAVNIAATARLFDAAGAESIRRVVFASSLYAYGSLGPAPMAEADLPAPRTVYGVSKLAGEHLLRVVETSHGMSWSVARLFFIYGPRQLAAGGYPSVIVRNFGRIRRGEQPVVNGDGRQALDYVFVEDCIEGLLRLAESDQQGITVNVASGRAVSVEDLTAQMIDIAGSSLEPIAGPSDWTAGTSRSGTTTLASERLGWEASTSLEVGLRRVWESMSA